MARRGRGLLAVLLCAHSSAMPTDTRRELREEVRRLFSHGWDNYRAHAFPADALAPLSCTGEDVWGGIVLTLLDTLDTLALMGNATEFEFGVRYCVERLSFDVDETVSLGPAHTWCTTHAVHLPPGALLTPCTTCGAGLALRDQHPSARRAALGACIRLGRFARSPHRPLPGGLRRRIAAARSRSG